jgi:hypothetical protein
MKNFFRVLGIIALALVLLGLGVGAGLLIGDRLSARTQALSDRYGLGKWTNEGNEPVFNGRGNRGERWEDFQERDGMMGGRHMQGFVPDASLVPADGERLTIEQAARVAEAYLEDYGNDNLTVAEVMQFDNNFYVAIKEMDTEIGAFELLIDPQTAEVYPEPGPNMMWNTKYGMMQGRRGVMGSYRGDDVSGEMTVTPERARDLALKALEQSQPGATIAEEAEAFYGYYTLDILRDGEPAGMLSVNGYSGRVWIHSWHGVFVDMIEEDD